MIHTEDSVVALHEGRKAVRTHDAGAGQGNRPGSPAAEVDPAGHLFSCIRFISADIEGDPGVREVTAPDVKVETIPACPKSPERKSMIVRHACPTIEYLDEGMGIITQENTGYDRAGFFAPGIDQFEIPALKARPALVQRMMEMEFLGSPDPFNAMEYHGILSTVCFSAI